MLISSHEIRCFRNLELTEECYNLTGYYKFIKITQRMTGRENINVNLLSLPINSTLIGSFT